MKEHKTRHVRIAKSMANEYDISCAHLKRNSGVLFVLVVFAVYAPAVYSNGELTSLQQDINHLANGGKLTMSKSYDIDGTLLIKNKSNVTIDGNGVTITQLKHRTITIKIEDCNSVTIKNLVLIGDPCSYEPFKATDGLGIYMQGCTGQHLLEGVKFYDHGCAGFRANNVSNITFNQCLFKAEKVNIKAGDVWNCGIWSYNEDCDNWEIKNCTFEKLGMGMILYKGHDHLSIHDNTFKNIRGQHGMYLNASSHVNIFNNTLANVQYIAIKLQMNNGHDKIETDIRIADNDCNNSESTKDMGQAGIIVGSAKPNGPAKGVYWENVCIEGNKVNRFNYGIEVNYTRDVDIVNNKLTSTTYGILALPCSGRIYGNNIKTTKWSGIHCSLIKGLRLAIVGNVIRDAVHISSGDIYKRCGIFLTDSGTVELENNQMYRDTGQPLYGLYQDSDITFARYHNNRLLNPIELKGKVVSQMGNEIH